MATRLAPSSADMREGSAAPAPSSMTVLFFTFQAPGSGGPKGEAAGRGTERVDDSTSSANWRDAFHRKWLKSSLSCSFVASQRVRCSGLGRWGELYVSEWVASPCWLVTSSGNITPSDDARKSSGSDDGGPGRFIREMRAIHGRQSL